MKIPGLQTSHLTYCSNIHPGETWAEVKASLQQHLPLVKKNICAENPFGVGLRLSALAASELLNTADELKNFKAWLDQEDLYVFTINGFPYGTFHGQAIKELVYQPDWSSDLRLTYSKELASILAFLLPKGVSGSISTVPIGFKSNFTTVEKLQAAVENLLDFVVFAFELEQKSGQHIAIALEPEPGCFLETTLGTLDFFKEEIYSDKTLELLYSKSVPEKYCELATIKRYLGVCLDTCHAAVMFEEPLQMARDLREANISIPKIQLTAALKVNLQESKNFAWLQAYAEGNYLHQTCLKNSNDEVRFFLDLPETLKYIADENKKQLVELRSHFHVPVFVEQLEGLETTQAELLRFVQTFKAEKFSSHFEVETYTFDVLPKNLLKANVDASITRELAWVLEAVS